MTHTRARTRSIVTVMSVGVLLAGTLAGCISPESREAALKRYGYSNIQNLKNEGRPNSYRATLNNCTLDLSVTADKEIWTAVIVDTPRGDIDSIPHIPGENAFEYAHDTEALRKDPRFTKFCP